MHQRRGVQAEAGAEGRGRAARRGHGGSMARAAAPTHPASPMGLRKCIGGEEVAATFRDTEDFSPRALCLCRYAPPATYSPALTAFYLFVKKKKILRSKDKAVSEANTLLKGERKNQKKKSVYHDTLSNGQKLVSKLRNAGD